MVRAFLSSVALAALVLAGGCSCFSQGSLFGRNRGSPMCEDACGGCMGCPSDGPVLIDNGTPMMPPGPCAPGGACGPGGCAPAPRTSPLPLAPAPRLVPQPTTSPPLPYVPQ